MDQSEAFVLPPVNPKEVQREIREHRRISPWDLLPGIIRNRHIIGTLTIGGKRKADGALYLKDLDNKVIVTLNKDGIAVAETGDITVGGDSINTNAEIFSHLSVEHFWTGSGSYIDRTGAFFTLNGDNFVNQAVYFEAVMGVEQNGRTAYIKIYNVTDSADLAGSEITTAVNSSTSPDTVRSAALTIPSGIKKYKLMIKQAAAGNGGDNSHYYAARLVITQA